MRRKPPSHITGTILGATAGVTISITATVVGWPTTLAITAVPVLALLAIRALRHANGKHDQIFDDELGGPGPNKGLGPKDLAMDLRVHGDPTVYRDDPTDTGETR